jgi:probable F420-dependent oxidoreductase
VDVRFGFSALGSRPDEIVLLAGHAERLGFHFIGFGDHLLEPTKVVDGGYPYGPRPRIERPENIDPLVQAAGVTAATSEIEILSGVYLLPMHHPLVVARALSTLQTIAGGRFLFGVGAGWMREEFDAIGVPFKSRGRRFDEALEVIRRAGLGGPFGFSGEHFSFEEIMISERAVATRIIVGGSSPSALRRAARYGDGWFGTPDKRLEELVELRDRIETLRAGYGTSGAPFMTIVSLPEPSLDTAARYLAQGFRTLNLPAYRIFDRNRVPPMTLDEKVEALTRLADDLNLVAASAS